MLIIGINSGSYSKITYKHIHKFIVTINIDIAIYNLQHTLVHALCISISLVDISLTHIYSKSYTKSHSTN
jgi:hypothetical protein